MIDINNESGVDADELGLIELAHFALERLRIHPQATSVSWASGSSTGDLLGTIGRGT